MKVRPLERRDEAAWDDYVRGHAHGTFFHLLGWRDQVVEHYGCHEPRYLLAERDDGTIAGVLPLFRARSLSGEMLVSVPYAVYGGILADDAATEPALLDAARELKESLGVKLAEFRCLHRPASDLPTSDLYVTFLRDLPDDPDECLSLIPRKSRASTRHARDRHGMELVEAADGVDAFYELFVENKRALGSPVFSRRFFRSLLDRFGERCTLHHVRHEGQVIAACVSFVHGETFNPYYSGSLPGTERLGSMNFMYWRLMEEAVKRGHKRFDFGRSRARTGPCKFKRNMGFEETPLTYQFLLGDGAEIPNVNPSNPRFDVVKNTWKRLPLPVVKRVGPHLMRYLP